MTLEANMQTKHSVPVCDGKTGNSGSLVARTITEQYALDTTLSPLSPDGTPADVL